MYQARIYITVLLLLKQIYCLTDQRLEINTSDGAVTPCPLGLQFLVALNNTSGDDLEVELSPDECCLDANNVIDCDIVQLTGCYGVVPKDSVKTMKMIAPLLGPYNRYGYCSIYVDSKPKTIKRGIIRKIAKINFDTRIDFDNKLPSKVEKCKNLDEDPLNNCKTVDCESYYNGIKPFFDKRMKRCVEVPPCIDNPVTDVPEVIYDENTNKCIRNVVTKEDVDTIKEMHTSKRVAKDIVMINNLKSENHKKSKQSVRSTTNGPKNTKYKTLNYREEKSDSLVTKLKAYFKNFPIMFFSLIIVVQCCLMCGIVYYSTKSCTKCCKNDVVRKFFNYRQDVSVTTPLINTSNVDTETDCHYLSDSCNNDKKIKHYKARQKERKHHITKSMSDDILCKCLDRCIIARHEVKSDTVTDKDNIVVKEEDLNKQINDHENTGYVTRYAANKTEVNYDNEDEKRTHREFQNVENIKSNTSCNHRVNKSDCDELSTMEIEIKCHDFEGRESFQTSKTETCGYVYTDDPCKHIHTTVLAAKDNEAQAIFPDDSLDEYLSQKGMIYEPDENFYSYPRSSDTDSKKYLSNKTSKNILRYFKVLSIFKKKSSSDSSFNPEFELKGDDNAESATIHNISREALYNDESDYVQDCAKVKKSRSSI